MNNLTVSASPHITNKSNSTRNIMLDVIIALLIVLLAAVFYFGYHVIINAAVCVGACVGSELLFCLIARKKFDKEGVKQSSIFDLSAVVTGLILALNLPSKTIVKGWDLNIYQKGYDALSTRAVDHIIFSFDTVIICIIGSIFAIMIVKMLFGGIGKNFANPAVTARIFLMLSFGLSVVNTAGVGLAASTGATWLASDKSTGNQSMFLNYFLGNRGTAAVGETCMIALILSYVYLSARKVIDFRLPLIIIGSAAVFSLLFEGFYKGSAAKIFNNMFANILSGGLVFGSVFMATDYSTSPNTFVGQVVFGVGIGLFTMLIRVFTGMPEGMSFAILLMNVATPLIDKYIFPKPFGYVKPEKRKKAKDGKQDGKAEVKA